MARRLTGKVSGDNPEEGLTNLLAKMMGVEPSEIHLSEEVLNNITRLQKEKLEVKEIINPFFDNLRSIDSKESKKKINELIDLGKFLYTINSESKIEIVECGERPDFILRYKSELVGVEHTGIFDDGVVAEISRIKKIISKCQRKLENEQPGLTGLFNLIVVPSKLKSNINLKEEKVIQQICDQIVSKREGTELRKLDFIDSIVESPHPALELTLGEDYWLLELTPEMIGKTISKKESMITTYKSLKKLDQCWLLVVIEGASSSSSFKIGSDTLPENSTLFDKVFIFDNFKRTVFYTK